MSPPVLLVIESNPKTRAVVRLTLVNQGFTVIEAGNGAEALAQASKTAPDLVLQDLHLPDMDGYGLVRRLRALPNLAGVPIVAFSGFLSRVEHGQVAAAGFTDFIPKPVEPAHLVQVVRTHLSADLHATGQVGRGRRILIVDDDPVQLKLARIRLTLLGFDVTTATDGAAALDVLQRGGVEAVLSDVLMPVLDGFGLCAAVRADAPLSQLPVILVSSNYVEDADRALALQMGATAFVVRTPDLVSVIQALDAAVAMPCGTASSPSYTAHHERIVRQLERQSELNAASAQQSAMHASILSGVADICESLTKRDAAESAAPDILATLLEASGVSMGALYVRESGAAGADATGVDGLVLRAHLGGSAGVGEDSRAFFGHRALFDHAVASRFPVVLTSTVERSVEQAVLARAGMTSGLLIPCITGDECLALVFLASKARDLAGTDWIPFARTIAVQLGQAFSLGRAFATQHQTVEALRSAQERTRFALENANVGIWDLDYVTGQLRWSEILEGHYGFTAGTFPGTFEALVERIHPDDRVAFLDAVGAAVKSGADFTVQNRSLWPDGTVRWLSGAGRVHLDEHGAPVRGVGISQDITESHLQRLRVFQATMRTVQDIVNNLLNGLQLVHLEAEESLAPEVTALVEQVIQEAAVKLKALGNLETVTEREMVTGAGIDFPGAAS